MKRNIKALNFHDSGLFLLYETKKKWVMALHRKHPFQSPECVCPRYSATQVKGVFPNLIYRLSLLSFIFSPENWDIYSITEDTGKTCPSAMYSWRLSCLTKISSEVAIHHRKTKCSSIDISKIQMSKHIPTEKCHTIWKHLFRPMLC